MKIIVAISYFHPKIGPKIFYSHPKNSLDKDLATKIANIMDFPTAGGGFFTHSFENYKSLNYYFEIHSDWARGNNEMLMVSIVFDQQILPEIEEKISDLCIEFSEKLQSNKEIYTAFYIKDLNFHENEKAIIIKNETLVKAWLNNLYWTIIENTRKKTEEEKIAILMNDKRIFETLDRLSKGPLPLEWLRERFFENFPDKDFEEIINILVDRLQPDSVIEYIDDKPELIDLLLLKVQDYYSEYEKKGDEELKEDTFILFQIMADPKKYKILSILRNGLISKDKLLQLVSKKSLDSLMENIEFLKKYDVIEELNYKGETYIVLKTNLRITTAFPEWMRKLLPKESEPDVANKYSLKLKDDDKDDDDFFPYPYIFKPPSPPGDLGLVGEPQAKTPITEKIQENEPYCKHCGSDLTEGQSICHVCKNKVD